MPNRRISPDVKIAAVRLYELNILSFEETLYCVKFLRRTFFRVWKIYQSTSNVFKPRTSTCGWRGLLAPDDIDYLLRLIRYQPDRFLDEFLYLLQTNCFISVHYKTILRDLQCCRIERKNPSALQRSVTSRSMLTSSGGSWHMMPSNWVCIDKTSKDKRTCIRHFGRTRSGQRAAAGEVFVRGRRLIGTGFMTTNGMTSLIVTEGSMTQDKFVAWMKDHVVRPLPT
jgi:hypothetical protein